MSRAEGPVAWLQSRQMIAEGSQLISHASCHMFQAQKKDWLADLRQGLSKQKQGLRLQKEAMWRQRQRLHCRAGWTEIEKAARPADAVAPVTATYDLVVICQTCARPFNYSVPQTAETDLDSLLDLLPAVADSAASATDSNEFYFCGLECAVNFMLSRAE